MSTSRPVVTAHNHSVSANSTTTVVAPSLRVNATGKTSDGVLLTNTNLRASIAEPVTATHKRRITAPLSESSPSSSKSKERTYFAVKQSAHVRNGIFLDWEDCRSHVADDPPSQYTCFNNWEHAETYLGIQSPANAQKYADTFGSNSSKAGQEEDGSSSSSRSAEQETTIRATAVALSSITKGPAEPCTAQDAMDSTTKTPQRSDNWMKEDYSEDPPTDQWWRMYFFLCAYKKRYCNMNLEKEKVQEIWEKEGYQEAFQLKEFWVWCKNHKSRYNHLSPEVRDESVKVKHLTDLGFEFQGRNKKTPGEKNEEALRAGGPPSKKQKTDEKTPMQLNWESMYGQAIAYRQAHGNFDVPADTSDEDELKLRKWIQSQRLTYHHIKDGKGSGVINKYLTEAKIRRLQSLKFPFEGKSAIGTQRLRQRKPHPKWLKMLEQLKDYHQTTNSFEVMGPDTPQGQAMNAQDLYQWLKDQNQQFARMREGERSTMTEEKIKLMADIGYRLHYVTFAENLEQLKAYLQENGTHEIPPTHSLSKWTQKVKGQLQRLEEGNQGVKLTTEQAQELKELGFFNGKKRSPVNEEEDDRKWDEMCEKLKSYKEEHGDCLISTSNFTDPLVKWVLAQRRYYKTIERKGESAHLNARRLQKLHEIGFVFRQKKGGYKSFDERVNEMREFRAKYGHLRILTSDPDLGYFVAHCRDQFRLFKIGKKSSMTEEKVKILTELGFDFQVGKSPANNFPRHTWDERFQQLLQYKGKYGHTIVPQLFVGFNNLGQWVKTQRENYRLLRKGKKTSMTHEMALKLTDIGFVWEATAAKKKQSETNGKDGLSEAEEGTSPLRQPLPVATNRIPIPGVAARPSNDVGFQDKSEEAQPRFFYNIPY
jgi:hypothetical protein